MNEYDIYGEAVSRFGRKHQREKGSIMGNNDKRTRKEWALAFGVSYQIMAKAVARKFPDMRQRESTFDEKTARDALIGYYAWQRERRLRNVRELDAKVEEIRYKNVSLIGHYYTDNIGRPY